jgi:CheY-like chemotaxis protein
MGSKRSKSSCEPVSLLIVDVNMPQMDGFTFLEAVRRQQMPLASTPALITSTEGGPQDFAAARAAGANFYLVKPSLAKSSWKSPQCFAERPYERVRRAVSGRVARAYRASDGRSAGAREDTDDRERLDSAFRAFHTLKGSAGIVDFTAMADAVPRCRGRAVGSRGPAHGR